MYKNMVHLDDDVQVYIGDDLVHTDYVDDRPINYNATSVVATISGLAGHTPKT